ARSNLNSINRSKSNEKHRCGAKSIPVRVDEWRHKNEGELPTLSTMYHETHFNPKKNQWVTPECEGRY
ncbi:polygalacturonate 4-alpha-galacturonosyltransferase-like, partial [Fagus crenata]